jgi:NAD(P)-dependent dehydrogenase (short-subunit alcohol dehydrogenase family)
VTQVVLVTGATDGLGKAVSVELARAGATVLVHGRTRERAEAALAEIRDASGSELLRAYAGDFASLAQVRSLGEAVAAEEPRLDVLVNNAGIGTVEPGGGTRVESADGHELRFAVNYLAPFLLTQSLLPLLRASAPARVVHVASRGQHPLDFTDLMLERDYSGQRAYRQSKLAQIISGFELAGRLPAAEVTVNSLHPATFMPTKIVLEEHGRSIDELETGVAATVRLVSDPSLAGVTGRFFDRQRDARANAQAYDRSVRTELWQRSLHLTGAPDFP